ncbi:MAG: phage baseplate assembly protein V, partial [Bacteroidota bacterium]
KVKAGAWDFSKQSWEEATAASPSEPGWGNINGKKLSEVVGPREYEMVVTPPVEKDLLKTWASARLTKSRLAKIRGKVSSRGAIGVEPNKLVELQGVGDRFSGDVWVSGVTHKVEDGEWIMDLKIGLSPNWFAETTPDIMMPPAAGLNGGIYGLQNAKVLQIHEDPDGEFRIKVDLPTITGAEDGVWARMVHLYASKEIGTFFLPEVGDEVIVGFLNNDPTYPVIMGMVYSKEHKAPFTPDEPNTFKGIVTKSEMKLTFEDEKKWVKLETPGGNSLLISDDEQLIKLEDQHGNKIVMDSNGITMETPKDFVVKATGKITKEATGEVSIKSSGGDVKAEGLNVKLKASIGFAAEGSATAELKASGQTTVKGAMVMIN